MTLSLVLLIALSQAEVPPEALPTPGEQPPAARPVDKGDKNEREPISPVTRSLLAGGGGALAGGASLGIALLLVGSNPNFDPTFATAALATLMITGVTFALHQALGGQGEITLSFLLTAIVMAGAGALGAAIGQGHRTLSPVLAAAIGSVPAAGAAVFALEATTPKARKKVALAFGPTGFSGTF